LLRALVVRQWRVAVTVVLLEGLVETRRSGVVRVSGLAMAEKRFLSPETPTAWATVAGHWLQEV
jgi:hypothetical protein